MDNSNPGLAPVLLLASGSPYRRELLARLRIPFAWQAPEVDETPRTGEDAFATVMRLALIKAEALRSVAAPRFVVGSDQLAVVDGELIGKPGNYPRALRQLSRLRGRRVTFLTGLCLLDRLGEQPLLDCVVSHITLRSVSEETLVRYLEAERPYDCAGSIKCEGLGITLIERFDCVDPTALLGLPLIRLTAMLFERGYDVLQHTTIAT
ncbi:MAG: septum formation protein Maf [Gammaproteobacteria bacterium]|nr:septum formation protein Maf [Gammaproteobacteria bacterium]